ncbi:MAG TPA: AAA family ATPase [Anaerolineaceae bacterium]|nr:AAA family ATPase [Anaerolineaceae bacterium]
MNMQQGSALRILLLGPPAVYLDEEPLIIPRRKIRALLFYLACQSVPVERSHLVDVFWAMEDEAEGRRNLREALTKLRSALPDPSLIITPNDQIGLDFSRIFVDVREFRQLTRITGINPRAVGDPVLPLQVFQRYQQAVGLWRYPQFLAGADLPSTEALDDWLTVTSAQLDSLRRNVLLRLADHQAAVGDLEDALFYVRQSLVADPVNIGLHRRLLEWLLRLERYAEVQSHCDFVSSRLPEEEEGLLQVLAEFRQKVNTRRTPAEKETNPAWENADEYAVRFVGRQAELDTLQRLYTRGGTALVLGEAGLGKTRLLYELSRCVEPSPRLMMVSCHRGDADVPMQAWIDLLRRHVTREEWLQLDPVWVSLIARILPELYSLQPRLSIPDAAWATDARPLLFEAIHQLIQLVSRGRRLLVVIDNAHDCDEESFSTLDYLLQRYVFQSAGLLVLAARPEQDAHALTDFLSRAQPGRQIQVINLQPLDMEETTELAAFLLRHVPSPNLVQQYHRATTGNPLFLIETLREFPGEMVNIPVSSSLQAVIRDRFHQLTPGAQQTATVAAVIGSRFPMWLLYSVTGLPPEQLLATLEELLKKRLIQADEDHSGSGGYRFVHDQFAEIIYEQINPPHRQLLHLQIARALAASAGSDDAQAGVLAYHYEAGGDLQAAFTSWLASGIHARQVYSRETAFHAFNRAEALLKQLGIQVSDEDIYRLYAEWDRVGYFNSDYREIEHSADALIQAGEERQNPFLLGIGLRRKGSYYVLVRQPSRALIFLERAYHYLVLADNVFELAGFYSSWANCHALLNRYSEAIEIYERALQLVYEREEPQLLLGRVTIGHYLARFYVYSGYPLKATEKARTALEDAHRLVYPSGVVLSRAMLAFAALAQGQVQEAFNGLTTALEEAREIQTPWAAIFIKALLAHIHTIRGQLDLAWQLSLEMLEEAAAHEQEDLLVLSQTMQGEIFLYLEDYPRAMEVFRQASWEQNQTAAGLYNLMELGTAMSLHGDTAAGAALLTQAASLGRQAGLGTVYLQAEMIQGYNFWKLGLYDQARIYLDQVTAEYQTRGISGLYFAPEWASGQMALEKGQTEEAFRLSKELLEKAKQQGNIWLRLQSLELMMASMRMEGHTVPSAGNAQLVLDELVQNTSTPALQESVRAFRKKAWDRIK